MGDKVLIVDDEAYLLKACHRLLMDEPYECVSFSSPKKALEEAPGIRPAVVISDQRMPEMSGVEFLEKIKETIPSAVRIITTGYADIDTTIDAINKGQVFRFIRKPWVDLHLKLEIRQALKYYHMTEKLIQAGKESDGIQDLDERFKGVLEMAGAVCHEFSQPLQVISGYCGLLMDDSKKTLSKRNTWDYPVPSIETGGLVGEGDEH